MHALSLDKYDYVLLGQLILMSHWSTEHIRMIRGHDSRLSSYALMKRFVHAYICANGLLKRTLRIEKDTPYFVHLVKAADHSLRLKQKGAIIKLIQ